MIKNKKWIFTFTLVILICLVYPSAPQSLIRTQLTGPGGGQGMLPGVLGTSMNILLDPLVAPVAPVPSVSMGITPILGMGIPPVSTNVITAPFIAPTAMNPLGSTIGATMPSMMISPAAPTPLVVNSPPMGNQGMLPTIMMGMLPVLEIVMPGPMMGMPGPIMMMPSPMMGMPGPIMMMPSPMMGMPGPLMMPDPMMGMPEHMMGMPEHMMGMPEHMMGMPEYMMSMPHMDFKFDPSLLQISPAIPNIPSIKEPTRKGGPTTAVPIRVANQVPGATPYNYFEDPITCAGGPGIGMCHANKFAQWETDQHARSWTGDFMVAQYYDLARPDADLDPAVEGIKIGCVKCHSPTAYYALGDALLTTPPPRPAGIENAWNPLPGNKTEAERGIFCDFCHTLSAVGTPPVNGNFENAVTAAIDPKRGPLLPFVIPGVAPHEVIISPLHDDPMICGTCHDETSPFGMLVKGTYTEWLNSPYAPDTRCQDCHQRDVLLMGLQLYSMNFKGGFSPWVEGTASVVINAPASAAVGGPLAFSVVVTNDLIGHHFPSGSEEERQLWLHVTATDAAGNVWHIPITLTPDTIDPANPNHEFWVTTNAPVAWPSPNPAIGVPIPRDTLPEGDRLYHSIFLSPANLGSVVTYAQYYSAQRFSNRLVPFIPVEELYSWIIPPNAVSPITITAELNYRRMPDSMADFLGIQRRPIILVNSASALVTLI